MSQSKSNSKPSSTQRILGPISLLDCAVFLILLAPQLLLQAGLLQIAITILQTLPFLLLRLPFQLLLNRLPLHLLSNILRKVLHKVIPKTFLNRLPRDPLNRLPLQLKRHVTPSTWHRPTGLRISLFEDLVLLCVRHAFAKIPASVGAVFFSPSVSRPFFRFRQLRHGWWERPVQEVEILRPGFRGALIVKDPSRTPDVIVFYAHGGGFSMGSAAFYAEFLGTWVLLLKERGGWENPAVLAGEYTLVPDAAFPTQLREVREGYAVALELVGGDPDKVCVAGDSAGGTLVLSLLLSLAIGRDGNLGERDGEGRGESKSRSQGEGKEERNGRSGSRENGGKENESRREGKGESQQDQQKTKPPLPPPRLATLISPWCTLVSSKHIDSSSDYLNAASLHLYARQYVGGALADGTPANKGVPTDDFLASPGSCEDMSLWRRAAPTSGFHFMYGAGEVLAPTARDLVRRLAKAGISEVSVAEREGAVHAWPVVDLFLKDGLDERLAGLREVVDVMVGRMG